jgi:hypothetical protein
MSIGTIRFPDRYADPPAQRHRKKWERIIGSFMSGDLESLRVFQRTGARGRVFRVLIEEMLSILEIRFRVEPIFDHISPHPWYEDFAGKHDLKLRTDSFYNPDFFFEDGTRLEVTLSENSAYKKVLRYGHQADELMVIWLEVDQGLHKTICQGVAFPNARVESVDLFFDELAGRAGGEELIRKFETLKRLKGIML